MTAPLLELPPSLRGELKEPMGPIYTDAASLAADAEALAADAGDPTSDADGAAGDADATSDSDAPLVAVGDIVTYHLLSAGYRPDVALVDDRTERSAVDREISEAITGFDRRVEVENPPATLTAALVEAIADAVAATDESTVVFVDGEEDLGALAAVLAVPEEGSVVYGQPGEGMVLVDAAAVADGVRDLLSRMDGDSEAAFDALDG